MTKEQAKQELEQLDKRRAELEAIINAPNVTPEEQRFLEIIDGCTIKIDKEKYPDSVFFFKGEKLFFELENSILWCRYDLVWRVFEKEFDMGYDEIQEFIKNVMEKHFKMKGVTPGGDLLQ